MAEVTYAALFASIRARAAGWQTDYSDSAVHFSAQEKQVLDDMIANPADPTPGAGVETDYDTTLAAVIAQTDGWESTYQKSAYRLNLRQLNIISNIIRTGNADGDSSSSPIVDNSVFIFEGDSLTSGAGLGSPTTQCWPTILQSLSIFEGKGTFHNFAVSGDYVANVAARYTGSVYPLRGIRTRLYLCIGTNDIWNGVSAATTYTAIAAYVATARADGIHVTIINIPDRENFTLAARVQAQELNRLLAETPVGDAYIDIAGVFSNYDDTTIYQGDKIHPNATGHILWAHVVNQAGQWSDNVTARGSYAICAGTVRANKLSVATKVQTAPLTVGGSFDATHGNLQGICESAADDAWTQVTYPRATSPAAGARAWMRGGNVGTVGAWEWAVSTSNSTAPSVFVMRLTSAGRLQALLGADITGAVDVTNGHLKIQPVDGGLDAAIITMYPKATSPDTNARSWSFGPNIGTLGAYEWAVSTTAGGAPATFAVRITKEGLLQALLGLSVTGAITGSTTVQTGGYTVATLPAGTLGMRAYVTDATAPTYLGALTGGGAVKCPVFYNGSAWVSG